MPIVDLARMAQLLGAQLPGGFQGVLLRKTSNQSIPDVTLTALSWQTEIYDVGGWFSAGTLVVVPPGISRVRMFAAGSWGSALGTTHTLRYVQNAGFVQGLPVSSFPSAVVEQSLGSPVIDVVPGDTLAVVVEHDSGVPADIRSASTTFFGVEAVR